MAVFAFQTIIIGFPKNWFKTSWAFYFVSHR